MFYLDFKEMFVYGSEMIGEDFKFKLTKAQTFLIGDIATTSKKHFFHLYD